MFYRKRRLAGKVTVAELLRKGPKTHGRSVWGALGAEFQFDFHSREIVSREEFASRQKELVKRRQEKRRQERLQEGRYPRVDVFASHQV